MSCFLNLEEYFHVQCLKTNEVTQSLASQQFDCKCYPRGTVGYPAQPGLIFYIPLWILILSHVEYSAILPLIPHPVLLKHTHSWVRVCTLGNSFKIESKAQKSLWDVEGVMHVIGFRFLICKKGYCMVKREYYRNNSVLQGAAEKSSSSPHAASVINIYINRPWSSHPFKSYCHRGQTKLHCAVFKVGVDGKELNSPPAESSRRRFSCRNVLTIKDATLFAPFLPTASL